MSITINSLEIENVKRVKAITLELSPVGLTVLGGRNGQGKTSVLDAIAWGLGGNKFKPSNPQYAGSTIPPEIKIVLSNGLVVQRKGKNAALTVTDPNGMKTGQQLLDSFIEQLALNLPKFMQATDREKASILLRVLDVEEQLLCLDTEEKDIYARRLAVGRVAEKKAQYAEELPDYPDAPEEPINPRELLAQQQEIMAKNAENARKRMRCEHLKADFEAKKAECKRLENVLAGLMREQNALAEEYYEAQAAANDLLDEATDELEANLERIDEINRQVNANWQKRSAMEDAEEYETQYNKLTSELEAVRKKKADLLAGVNLPLPGLEVRDGILLYNSQPWDCMSGAEQLRVATAIVRMLNPQCGFVLLDKLEQMDEQTMQDFGEWLKQEGLQAIATRVTTHAEDCTIIIEDGRVVKAEEPEPVKWKEGVF